MTYLLSKNYEDKTPVFLQDPYIDGTPQVGNTLTVRWFVPGYSATDPDWSVAYQWYWGAENTTLTEAEFDETGQALICTADHLTGYLSCRVAVTNPSGSVVKFAANVGPVTDYSAPSGTVVNPPQFNQAATLVGTPQAGRTLSVNYDVAEVPGVDYSYTFTWFRDATGTDPADETVSGATTSQYVPGAADVGDHLKCRVRCTNLAGTTESITSYSAEIQAADETIPVDAVVIDSGWLASTANGGPDGPWVLKGANTYYYLTTDVTQDAPTSGVTKRAMFYVANAGITLDLNGHTLTYHSGAAPTVLPSGGANVGQGCVGICLYLDWHNTEIAISAAAEPLNFTLKNGTIIGLGTGVWGSAVYGYRSNGATVQNMRIEAANGQDCATLMFANGGGNTFQVVDNILICPSSASRNRHEGPANIKCLNSRSYISRNVVVGGNSAIVCGFGSLVEANVLAHNSTVTNGYAVWLYRTQGSNCTVRDNICIPTSGRGILDNACANNKYHDNVILHLEGANAEFGSELNPPAIRIRYEAQNAQYYNNFSLGIGGTSHTACSGMYFSLTGLPAQSYAYQNTAYVVYYGTRSSPSEDYAKAVTLEGHRGPATTDIRDNAFFSNHWLLSVSGFDGATAETYQSADWPLARNSWDYTDGDAAYAAWSAAVDAKLATMELSADAQTEAESRIATAKAAVSALISGVAVRSDNAFWYTLYVSGSVQNLVDVLDSDYGAGVDPLSYGYDTTARSGVRVLRDKISAQVRLLNGPAQAVVSQEVTVTPVAVSTSHPGGDIYTTTTDASGYATLHAIRYALTRGNVTGALASQTETHVDIAVSGVGTRRVAIGDFASLTELDLTA